MENAFFNGLSKSEFLDSDPRELELLNRAKLRKREEFLNDTNTLNKNLASLISMAVWGDKNNFNKPLEKISLINSEEELTESEFKNLVKSKVENFMKEKGLK